MMLFGFTTAWAATINVPGDYATIQAAIDAASPGDVIKLLDDISGSQAVTIDKTLTIDGNDKKIDFGMTVQAVNVVIKDLTIEITAKFNDPVWAQYPAGGTDVRDAAIYLDYEIVSGNAVSLADGAKIQNVAFDLTSDDTNGNGGSMDGITVGQRNQDVEIEDCSFDLESTNTGTAILIARGSKLAKIEDNTFINAFYGASIEVAASGNLETLTELPATSFGQVDVSGSINRLVRVWTPGMTPFIHDYMMDLDFGLTPNVGLKIGSDFASALDAFNLLPVVGGTYLFWWDFGAPPGRKFYDLNVKNKTTDYLYELIQDAIDDASDNDVITLGDGTFIENIVINKPLTLQAGSTPVIDGGESGVVITITSNDVTLDGLTVQNGGQSDPDTEAGVLVFNADIDITGITIQNCTIQDNATGIGIVRGTGNTVQYNVIKNNTYGVGLAKLTDALPSTNNTVFDNDISNCAVGVYVDKFCAGNEIKENEIIDFSDNGIYLWATQNNSVTNNTITGATSGKSVSKGIELAWSSDNLIEGNTISACGYGIQVRKRIYTGNTIENNSITGNSLYGLIFHDRESPGGDTEVVIAECNWWGSADGNVIQTLISGDVDFTPWLITDNIESPICLAGSAYNVRLAQYYNSAQDAIDAADPGDEIEVYYQPGAPLNIDKELEIHYIFYQTPQ